jgi:hypothetical protein
MEISLPNFLIVGAAKSGTTSLYQYLNEHPEIFMSRMKEPRFLISTVFTGMSPDDPRYSALLKLTVTKFGEYAKLFENGKKAKAIGEATATYLYYYQKAIPNIKKYLNDVKIIIILRNPVDRAFSSYKHLVKECAETRSFERCLELEEARKKNNWSLLNLYKEAELYYNQVKAYLDNFMQVKIYLFDDLKTDSLALTKDVYRFLEVSDRFVPNTTKKYNISSLQKSAFLNDFFIKSNILKKSLKPIIDLVLPPHKRKNIINYVKAFNEANYQMKPKTNKVLKNNFREDILKLQEIINKDLSHWLN